MSEEERCKFDAKEGGLFDKIVRLTPYWLYLSIARRLYLTAKDGKTVVKKSVRIATISTAIATAVMIIAICVTTGFKKEVRDKLIGFTSHFNITATDQRTFNKSVPVVADIAVVEKVRGVEGVVTVNRVSDISGIMKTPGEVFGTMLRGLDVGYDTTFLSSYLAEGRLPLIVNDSVTKDILVSVRTAEKLELKVGDKVPIYFVIDGAVRARSLKICGTYDTGFSDYDCVMSYCDMRHVQKLLGWKEDQVTAVEVGIDDFENLENVGDNLFMAVCNRFDRDGSRYILRSVKEINPQIFSWLEMLDINVIVILVLMMLVSGFTICSSLIINVLEKVGMIGTMMSYGATTGFISKIFMFQTAFMVGRGVLIGNVIGIGFCVVQMLWHIVPLDPQSYYVDHVPVEVDILSLVILNIVITVVSILILVIPAHVISKIHPTEAMRFE